MNHKLQECLSEIISEKNLNTLKIIHEMFALIKEIINVQIPECPEKPLICNKLDEAVLWTTKIMVENREESEEESATDE